MLTHYSGSIISEVPVCPITDKMPYEGTVDCHIIINVDLTVQVGIALKGVLNDHRGALKGVPANDGAPPFCLSNVTNSRFLADILYGGTAGNASKAIPAAPRCGV